MIKYMKRTQLIKQNTRLKNALLKIQEMMGYGYANNNDDRLVEKHLSTDSQSPLRNRLLTITGKALKNI